MLMNLKMKDTRIPQDHIAKVLREHGVKAGNVAKVRPMLEGLPPDAITRLVREAYHGYDRDKFEDCSFLLAHKIKQKGIKPVPAVEVQKRTSDITDVAFWEARLKLVSQHGLEHVSYKIGLDRLLRVAEKVPAHYYDDQEGPSELQKCEQADAKKLSWAEFLKLVDETP